jgi:hypothetical protein
MGGGQLLGGVGNIDPAQRQMMRTQAHNIDANSHGAAGRSMANNLPVGGGVGQGYDGNQALGGGAGQGYDPAQMGLQNRGANLQAGQGQFAGAQPVTKLDTGRQAAPTSDPAVGGNTRNY